MIKIEFIIMSDRYYVSCHVEVLHAGNFLREKLLLHIFYKLPPLSQGPQGVAIALLYYCHSSYRPISRVVIGRRSTIDLDLYMSGTV